MRLDFSLPALPGVFGTVPWAQSSTSTFQHHSTCENGNNNTFATKTFKYVGNLVWESCFSPAHHLFYTVLFPLWFPKEVDVLLS